MILFIGRKGDSVPREGGANEGREPDKAPTITKCFFQVVFPVFEIIIRDSSILFKVRLIANQHRTMVAEEAESEETSTKICHGNEAEDSGGEVESAKQPEDEGEGMVEKSAKRESAENVPDEKVIQNCRVTGSDADSEQHGHEVSNVLVPDTHSSKRAMVIPSKDADSTRMAMVRSRWTIRFTNCTISPSILRVQIRR